MHFLRRIVSGFNLDIGIDLGTANTLVHVRNQGIIITEPSVVAVRVGDREVVAVGREAKEMLGRTPKDIIPIRPMRHGVIADFEMVEAMIRYFMRKTGFNKTWGRPRVAIGIPSGITEVEQRAVRESAEAAGAGEVYLIEESLAAAIGTNIPIDKPAGNLIVDIGGGTTEVSVISLGGIVVSNTIRTGGDDMDQAIKDYLKKEHNLVIGDRMAEKVKVEIGNAYPKIEVEQTAEVKGRDAISGLPRTVEVTSTEMRDCLMEPVQKVMETITKTLDQTPPDLAADISERGIILTGGGALLKGLDEYIASYTKVPVIIVDNPLTAVVLGASRYLLLLDTHPISYAST